MSLNLADVNIQNSSNLSYYITANGGFYLSASFTDIYTFGCCEYGSIEKAVEQNFSGNLPSEKVKDYGSVNNISFLNFPSVLGRKIVIKKGSEKFTITLWLADFEYSRCPLYMETPQQLIYGENAAYIKNIHSVSKPTYKTTKLVKAILNSISENESN